MRWLQDIARRLEKEAALKTSLEGQMSACMREGVNTPFQRGYLCALYWTWQQVGYPPTGASVAAEAMVTGGIVAGDDE